MTGLSVSAQAERKAFADLGVDSRFVWQRALGGGAHARVYAVHDQALGVYRALKLAHGRGMRRRFRAEYTRLSELRHPNIVRSYDFGVSSRGLPYYTMELLEGAHFSTFTADYHASGLGHLAMQVLDALTTIHARGWVHRDITPGNLLVVGSGAGALVRIVDPGLMVRVGVAGDSAGTMPYVAPEVVRGESMDGRADLYSLGIVLHEALVPGETAATLEELSQNLTKGVVAPERIDASIPSAFSEFVMRLVQPYRENRFCNASDAAAALAAIPEMRIGKGPVRAVADRLTRGGAVSHRSGTIDNVRRWARAKAKRRGEAVCVVSGEAGLGKTPFLRELGTHLNLDGFRVLRIRTSNAIGAPIPALERALGAIDPTPALSRKPSQLQLPQLSQPPWLPPAGRMSARLASRGIAEFAGRLGVQLAASLGERPIAVIIDDLHRADPAALEVLRMVGQFVDAAPAVFVCAGDKRRDGVDLAEALGPGIKEVRLSPLSKVQTCKLVSHRLHQLELPRAAQERIAGDCQGMPRLVERTIARMLLDGTIGRSGADYVFAGGRYRVARHGDADLIAARIARVQHADRVILWGAAVLGEGLTAEAVAAVADTAEETAVTSLASLAHLQILNAGEAQQAPAYLFASRMFRTAAYQGIPGATRRVLHDRAARWLECATDDAQPAAEERVEHYLKGSSTEKAISGALAAGDRAAAAFADGRAIAYYARAYARLVGPADPRSLSLAFKMGRILERSGELDRASAWYQTVLESAEAAAPGSAQGPAPGAADDEGELSSGDGERFKTIVCAILGLGGIALLQGAVHDARGYSSRALQMLRGHYFPSLRGAARRLSADVALQQGDPEAARKALEAARLALRDAGDDAQLVDVLLSMATLARRRGDISDALESARRALRAARRLREPAAMSESFAAMGKCYLRHGHHTAAMRCLDRALGLAKRAGDRLRQASALQALGTLAMRRGELRSSLRNYQHALELLRIARARTGEAACLRRIGVVSVLLGDLRAGVAALRAARALAQESGDSWGVAHSEVEIAHVFAELGQFERARELLEGAKEQSVTLQDSTLQTASYALCEWVAYRQGQRSDARVVLKTLRELIQGVEDPASRALALLYAGRIALSAGDVDAARQFGEILLDAVDDAELWDFEAAARGLLGQAAAGAGAVQEAQQHLRQALDISASQGMRSLEVRLQVAVAGICVADECALEAATRGMELLHGLAAGLPQPWLKPYLARRESQELRRAFQDARGQIFANHA